MTEGTLGTIAAALVASALSSSAEFAPVITEFMAANENTLRDEDGDLKKWAIPPTNTIASGGWIAFDETDGFHNPTNTGFGLDKAGEQVFLSYLPGTPADRVADAVRFKGQENGVTLGRHTDGEAFWQATDPTRGGANALAGTDIAIREIMYHPAPTPTNPENNTNDEYVELYNAGDSAVSLWTTAGVWRLDGEIDYSFPSNTTLAAGERVAVVSFAPETNTVARDGFLAAYGLTNGEFRLLGPFDGHLDNEGGALPSNVRRLPTCRATGFPG